ncbi:MAG: hypothetical protein JWO94_1923 [Verrucomicrobiaceae bacterium]|nr:hypothetical protein [Verrucomicrobiaceae bacterium]
MASARYLLPQHPSLSGPYTKEELYVLVDRGSLARGEIVVDRVTKRSHTIGELIDGMPRPRMQEPSVRMDRPAYQEFSGDTPWELGRKKHTKPVVAEEDGELIVDEEPEEAAGDEDNEEEEEDASEHLHFRGHPSWFSFLGGILLGLIILAASVASLPMGGKYLVIGVVLASVTFCSVVITRQLHEYFITDERVEIDWGLIGRSSKEIRIVDIRAIDVHQGGLLGFFGVGTVDFSSTASTSVEVRFKHVRRPHRLKELVRQLQRRAGAGGE